MKIADQMMRHLRTLPLAYVMTACAGDATGPADEPAPAFELRFKVTVTVRYLEVSSREACDGVALISREPREGQFQYRILVEAGDKYTGSTESNGYGSVLGEAFWRAPGELINFANRDFEIASLAPGEAFAVSLIGSEWDGLERDSRMDHRSGGASVVLTEGSAAGTFRDRRVEVGDDADCGLALVWDYSVTRRMVAVP